MVRGCIGWASAVLAAIFLSQLPGCTFPGVVNLGDPSARDTDGDGFSDEEEGGTNPGSDPDTSHVFSLRVGRHTDQPFSEDQVDAVFAEASSLLQRVQVECPDLATDVTFLRDGAVGTFDTAPAVLTTEAQLDAVFDEPYDVKIVHAMVGVCGIADSDEMSVILGCASTGESLVIAVEADPDVWAHEWGHVQGLPHRDNCPRNIMHSFELATNAVNDFERNAFLTPTPGVGAPRLSPDPAAVQDASHLKRLSTEPLKDWLKRVVTKSYLAGMPKRVLADLGEPNVNREAASHLLALLADPEMSGYRRNIVRALGFCGDIRGVGELIDRIEQPIGELTFDEFAAIAESLLALGRLVPYDASGAVLSYLIEGTEVSTWPRRGVTWAYGPHDRDAVHRLLVRLSIMGLCVSNDQRALEHLAAVRERVENGVWLGEDVGDQLDEAIARLKNPAAPMARLTVGLRQP